MESSTLRGNEIGLLLYSQVVAAREKQTNSSLLRAEAQFFFALPPDTSVSDCLVAFYGEK